MATILLNLPDDLKRRVIYAAQELGVSPRMFMVDAIRQAVQAVEQRSRLMAEAHEAKAEMVKEGLGYDANEVRIYLRQRRENDLASRPAKKPWRD